MSNNWVGFVTGERIGNDKPANHLGDVDSHMIATPEKVQYARLYWQERSSEEFDAYGTTGQKVVDRTTGDVYKIVTHDPHQAEKPADDLIESFVLSGGWIFYLKRLGAGVAAGTGLSAAAFGGHVVQNWDGTPKLVDAAGNTVPTRLLEGGRR
jgi:hypothetical protein